MAIASFGAPGVARNLFAANVLFSGGVGQCERNRSEKPSHDSFVEQEIRPQGLKPHSFGPANGPFGRLRSLRAGLKAIEAVSMAIAPGLGSLNVARDTSARW